MDVACIMHGGDEKGIQNFDWNPERKSSWETVVGGEIILKWILDIMWGCGLDLYGSEEGLVTDVWIW
jgi:hypothetical protein